MSKSLLAILLGSLLVLSACRGSTQQRRTPAPHEVTSQRILVVPHAADSRNQYGAESMAAVYAGNLRDEFLQVLTLWTVQDPRHQREVRALHTNLAQDHLMGHNLTPETWQQPWLPATPDLVGIFEVAQYGQNWSLYDPIGRDLPLEIIRLDPHLERETVVKLRVTFYDAENGKPIGQAIGEGASQRADHGRGFDWTETEAIDNLTSATYRLLDRWYADLQSGADRGTQPGPSAPSTAPSTQPQGSPHP